jgi:hypothetical protein
VQWSDTDPSWNPEGTLLSPRATTDSLGGVAAPLDVVWAHSLGEEDAADYDRFVAESPSGHYAQTRAFSPVERAARSTVARYALVREEGRLIGTALVSRAALQPLSLPLPWAMVERGPVCHRPGDLTRVALALADAARSRGVLMLSLMPSWAGKDAEEASRALETAGFRATQRVDGTHARTIRIHLAAFDGGQDAFLAEPARARLRTRARQAKKAGAVARRGSPDDWSEHRRLTDLMMRAQGKRPRSLDYHEALSSYVRSDDSRGALFVCELEGRILASAVVLRHGGAAVYAHGATTLEPSPITKSIPPLLAAIRWAHAEGCHTFDLGGIPEKGDSDPKRRRIAHVKLDFASEPVELVRRHTRIF